MDCSRHINAALRRVAPYQGQVDSLGQDREDYQQVFRLKALTVPPHAVYKAIKNESYDVLRCRRRRESSLLPVVESVNDGARLEARNTVGYLFQCLNVVEQKLLQQFILCDFSVNETYKHIGDFSVSKRGFWLRVNTLRVKCRKILEKEFGHVY